jgi:cytoskeletal protein RodZ
MVNNLSTVLQKAYEEFKAGNPIIILIVLLVVVILGSCWVWQTTYNSMVNTPTPRFSHPGAVAPFVPSIVQESSAIPPARASVTPIPVTATPTPTRTSAGTFCEQQVFPLRFFSQSDATLCTTWI